MDHGAYIVIPFIGPSSTRDLFGRVVDAFSNPFNYIGVYGVASWQGADAVHTRQELLDITDEVDETSFDPYATIRSAYIQHRADLVRNGGE